MTSFQPSSDLEPWILILGTADWNQPIATNQHYMSSQLAAEFKVTFVESIGLRRPEFKRRDISRIAKRLAKVGRPASTPLARAVPLSMNIISPLVIPIHRGLARSLNRLLLHRQLSEWLNYAGPKILWCYSPVTYGLEKTANAIVYHCVDLLAEFPGIDRNVIFTAERNLAARGATAAGSSQVVCSHLREQGFDPIAWPNVADVEAFEPKGMNDSREPRAIFAGNLSANKVDFKLLNSLVDAGVSLTLAGPISEGGGQDTQLVVDDLVSRGAKYAGMLDVENLAREFESSSVGLIPYLINSYTQGVSPLKTYEYLAGGLGVVSTPVPAVVPIANDVVVESETSDFVAAVRSLLKVPSDKDVDRRLAEAQMHSWTERGTVARNLARYLSSQSDAHPSSGDQE